MKELLIVTLAVLTTSLSTTVLADQKNEDRAALMELEKDYLVLINEPRQKNQKKKRSGNTDDEPDCE